MYHSITFGQLETVNGVKTFVAKKNTWDDWRLMPSSRPYAELPEPNANAVDIPFRDGSLDITEAVTGFVTYKDRSGSWDFYILNSVNIDDAKYWVHIKQEITNYLHGKRFAIMFEDDPEYYYEGRISVSGYKPGKNNSTISINYVLRPYKVRLVATGEDWKWDPFNFETGIVETLKGIDIPSQNDPYTVTLHGGRMRTGITITVATGSSNLKVSMTGESGSYTDLSDGTNELPEIVPEEGENTLYFTGTGTVTIDYREGSL